MTTKAMIREAAKSFLAGMEKDHGPGSTRDISPQDVLDVTEAGLQAYGNICLRKFYEPPETKGPTAAYNI